jgi:DNA-binding PadR family transcriptional regulator
VTDPSSRSSSYAVLLLVALRGPSSPYDLKRALGRLASQFWAVPHTQVYAETARLADEGLLSVEAEADGRRRRTYALTRLGRERLDAWLADPVAGGIEIRDEAELKLLGTELSDREHVLALAEHQVAMYRNRLAELEGIAAEATRRPERSLRYLGVPLGRAVFTAALEFWESVVADPPGDPQTALEDMGLDDTVGTRAASTKASTDHQRS